MNLKQHIREEWGEVKPPTKPPDDVDEEGIQRAKDLAEKWKREHPPPSYLFGT